MRTRHRPIRTCVGQLLLQCYPGRNSASFVHPHSQHHTPLRFLYPTRLFSTSLPFRKVHPATLATRHFAKQRKLLEGASDDAIDIPHQWKSYKREPSGREETILDRRKLFESSGPPLDDQELRTTPFQSKVSWKRQAQGQFPEKRKEMMAPGEWKQYVRSKKIEKRNEEMVKEDAKNKLGFSTVNNYSEGEVKSGVYNWDGSKKDELDVSGNRSAGSRTSGGGGGTTAAERFVQSTRSKQQVVENKYLLKKEEEPEDNLESKEEEEEDPFANVNEHDKNVEGHVDYRPYSPKKPRKTAIERGEDLNFRTYHHRSSVKPLEHERFKPANNEEDAETPGEIPQRTFSIPKVNVRDLTKEEQLKHEFATNPPPVISYNQMFDKPETDQNSINVLSDVPEVKPVHKNPLLFRAEELDNGTSILPREYSLLGTIESDMSSKHTHKNKELLLNESRSKVTFISGKEPHVSANTMAVLLENSMINAAPIKNETVSPKSALVFHFDVPADKFKDQDYDVLEHLKTCPFADLARPHQNSTSGNASTGLKSLKIFLSPLSFDILEPMYRKKFPNATILPLRISMDLLDHYDVWNIYSAAWIQGFVPPWFQQRGLMKDSVRSFEAFFRNKKFDFRKMMEQMDLRLTAERCTRVLKRMKLLYALVKIPKEQFQPVMDRQPQYDWAKWDQEYTYGSKNKPAIIGENEELLGPNSPEAGNLTIVDLTCPFLNQTSAGEIFDLVLKAYTKQQGPFILGMHQLENYAAPAPRHRRFIDRISDLALRKNSWRKTHDTDIIFTSREPMDLEHLANAVDIRILHRSHKEHLKSFRNTTEAQQKMYYGNLTKDDVQRRHVALGHTKNAGTYLNAKTAIVQCMSLREPKEVDRTKAEKEKIEHYINLRSNRDYLGPREQQEKSPWRSLTYDRRRKTKREAKLLENALSREVDGFDWHSQSIKVQIRERLTYDCVVEAEEVVEEEEKQKWRKHLQMVKEGKKLSYTEAKRKKLEEKKRNEEEEKMEKLTRDKEKLERWRKRKEERLRGLAEGAVDGEKNGEESGENRVVVADDDDGDDELVIEDEDLDEEEDTEKKDDEEERDAIKHEIRYEDISLKEEKVALENPTQSIANGEELLEDNTEKKQTEDKKEGENNNGREKEEQGTRS